jgi:ABC-2 type transport system ATP-binding protein
VYEVTDAFIAVAGLTKSYGAVRAVDGVDLSIARGAVVGIAGPNGSGKSTLARMLLGFSAPDGGTAAIDGLTPLAFRERHGVGFLREDGARGWDRLTPRQLISLREDADERVVQEAGDILNLASLMDRPIGQLSKGQWRICQVLYALCARPRFLVLDEPESGLDPAVLERLRTVVLQAAAGGATIVMLSHHLDEMALSVDRVLFMSQGKVRGEVAPRGCGAADLRDDYRRLVEAP